MSANKIDVKELKASYEQVHAPRELEERMINVEDTYQRKTRPGGVAVWSRRVAACFCCAMIGIAAASNISASAAEALQRIPVIGAISKVVTFRDDQSGDAEIKTPHITGLGDKNVEEKLNQEFDKYSDSIIAQYELDVSGMTNGAKEAVTSSYKVLVDNDTQLTIVIDTVFIRGSSVQMDRYYNIDKNTGKLLVLSDLFRDDADYVTVINTYLSDEIQKAQDDYFTGADGFKTIAANQNFYVNEDGKLVLVFDESSIAAAYRGVIEFTIPTNVISGILASESPVH